MTPLMLEHQDDADWEAPEQAPRPVVASLMVLVAWSGWTLAVAPGRVTGNPPTKRRRRRAAPPTPEGEIPAWKPRVCDGCSAGFTDRDEYLFHLCRQPVFALVLMCDFENEARSRTGRRRKCSPFPRARTKNLGKLSLRQRQAAAVPDLFDVEVQRLRPRTRAECAPAPPVEAAAIMAGDDVRAMNHCRPCTWVSCRHHLAFTVNPENGSIKENFPRFRIYEHPDGPGLQALETVVGTCALDICDDVDDGTQGIAGLLALYQVAASGKPIGTTNGLTLDEAKLKLGLSVERVRQVGARAMQEMRVALRRLENAQPMRRKP